MAHAPLVALGLPAPRSLTVVPGSVNRWETEDLAAFTDGVDMHQEPYTPTVRVVGRIRSQTVRATSPSSPSG